MQANKKACGAPASATALPAAPQAPLGNNTILAAVSKNRFENQLLKLVVDGKETLARRDFNGQLKLVDIDGPRALMFERQNAARLILGKKSRVHFCCRWNVHGTKEGKVAIQTNGTNARYKNLSVCGLGWVCPVCAHKISEHRRKEMQIAQDF